MHTMRIYPSIRVVGVILACLAILFTLGCKNEVEQRRLDTLGRLQWSGGTENDRRVRDSLSNAVACATVRSLATPQLVDAEVWIGSLAKTNGLLSVHWISDAPYADGLMVTFGDSSQVKATFDRSGLDEIEKEARGTVLHFSEIFQKDVPEIWTRLSPTNRVRVVLTTNGKPVSNELDVRIISP
jgi:hypothetical protein